MSLDRKEGKNEEFSKVTSEAVNAIKIGTLKQLSDTTGIMCEGGAQQVDRYLPEGRYKIQNISFTLPTSQCCYGYCNSPLARKPWLPFYFYFGTGISRHWQGKPKAKRIQEVLAPRLSHSTQRNKLKLNREVTFFFFFKNRYGIIFRMQGN